MVFNGKNKIIMLGGPTASGKSSLALKWAKELDGEIINADSMQIYQELNVLTACPTEQEMAMVPHHLYRCLKGNDPCDAQRWRIFARDKIDEIFIRGKTPIVVGGTGLYFKALVYGLSKIPDIDGEIRSNIRQTVKAEGIGQIYLQLKKNDPEMADKLDANDSQRVSRALEVILSTGKSLKYWQSQPLSEGLIDEDVDLDLHVVFRDRAVLYERCDTRFKKMIEDGKAIEEVQTLLAFQYPLSSPVMKSLGVPQIIDYLEGKTTLDDMVVLSQTATRQFAKRQMTWFRNQFPSWKKEFL